MNRLFYRRKSPARSRAQVPQIVNAQKFEQGRSGYAVAGGVEMIIVEEKAAAAVRSENGVQIKQRNAQFRANFRHFFLRLENIAGILGEQRRIELRPIRRHKNSQPPSVASHLIADGGKMPCE